LGWFEAATEVGVIGFRGEFCIAASTRLIENAGSAGRGAAPLVLQRFGFDVDMLDFAAFSANLVFYVLDHAVDILRREVGGKL
jgi:hypothetical protein